MKNLANLYKIAVTIILATTPGLTLAVEGGAGPGGGNSIESRFKAKTIEIFKNLEEMDEAAQAKLSFPVELIQANLKVPGRFKPLCASDHTLEFIVRKQKMAYVGAELVTPNTISLDCRPERDSEWEKLFASQDDGVIIWFIHEALRNARLDGISEDDYGTSASYLTAKKLNDRIVYDAVKPLLFPGLSLLGSKCSAEVIRTSTPIRDLILKLFLKEGGSTPIAESAPFSGANIVRGSLEAKIMSDMPSLQSWLYNEAKKWNCF